MVLPTISSFLGHSFVIYIYIYIYEKNFPLSLTVKYLANIAELGVGREIKDTFKLLQMTMGAS